MTMKPHTAGAKFTQVTGKCRQEWLRFQVRWSPCPAGLNMVMAVVLREQHSTTTRKRKGNKISKLLCTHIGRVHYLTIKGNNIKLS